MRSASNMEPEYTLGIDLGGTKILAAVIDRKGQILSRVKKKTRANQGERTIFKRIITTGREAIEQSGLDPNLVTCAGIGTPGPVDSRTGIVRTAPNLGFQNINLKEVLERDWRMATFVFNDVNAGAWSEFILGAGHGSASCLGVFVGTGIGAGLIFDHRLYEGAYGFAGEIGHMVLDVKGPLCGCGRRGCLEALASRTAIDRAIRAALAKGQKSSLTPLIKKKSDQIRSGQLKQAYEAGDKLTRRALDRAAFFLGIGLGSVANLINPDCIVLGGGLVTALGEPYLEKVRTAMQEHCFSFVYESTRLVQASLGDDAGVLGAALLAGKSWVAQQRRPASRL